MTMRAGSLIHPITIERSTITIDDAGVPHPTWTTLAEVRAEIVDASTAETQHDSGTRSETTITFRLRYVPGLDLADQVIHGGYAHRIISIKEPKLRREHEIEVRRIGP